MNSPFRTHRSATFAAWVRLFGAAMLVPALTGCTWMSYLGTTDYGRELGKTFFVGGAGPLGNVTGTMEVPRGLRKAGYRGAIEVFGWQSVIGGTLRDQMDRKRNEQQARRLAGRIRAYMDAYPGRRVNLIGLSAGTGIITWAIESLPEEYQVGTVVFLGSSLYRRYDMTRAMQRIDGHLHCFYSARDRVLRFGLPLAGTVDRKTYTSSAVGLYGLAAPADADVTLRNLYRARLRNHAYRPEWRRYGYHGQHTDCVSPRFIAHIIGPLLNEPLQPRNRAARVRESNAHESTERR